MCYISWIPAVVQGIIMPLCYTRMFLYTSGSTQSLQNHHLLLIYMVPIAMSMHTALRDTQAKVMFIHAAFHATRVGTRQQTMWSRVWSTDRTRKNAYGHSMFLGIKFSHALACVTSFVYLTLWKVVQGIITSLCYARMFYIHKEAVCINHCKTTISCSFILFLQRWVCIQLWGTLKPRGALKVNSVSPTHACVVMFIHATSNATRAEFPVWLRTPGSRQSEAICRAIGRWILYVCPLYASLSTKHDVMAEWLINYLLAATYTGRVYVWSKFYDHQLFAMTIKYEWIAKISLTYWLVWRSTPAN